MALHNMPRALLVLLGLCASLAAGDEPEWVRKRPVVQGFYVGIGMARKNGSAAEYTGAANAIARNDIAAQISVSISSDVLRTVLEKDERVKEEFQSRIRASATADLEGVEPVDTYESEEEYWVYARLSKADYEARRAEKLNAALNQSLDLYSGGRMNERRGEVGTALGLYAQAFAPIEKYLSEPLLVQYEGESVYLVNELYGSLRSLLNRIEVRAAVGTIDANIGRPLKKPLQLAARLKDPGSTPVAGLPFRFAFTRGSGDCVDRVQTDREGIARCEVQKITSSERVQTVEAMLDLSGLAGGERMTPVVRTVIGSFTLPGTSFLLNVSGVEVFVSAKESVFGEPQHQKRIEPLLKSELGGSGFSFVDDRSKAALAITIQADVRKGNESYGLAFAYASATVSVVDLETGREIFRSAVNDLKEGSDSFEKAGQKSLNSLAKKIAGDVVPRIIEKVQK